MKKTENTQAALSESAAQPLPMKVDVKIGSIRPEGSVRAIASVNLNGCFAIRNVKIMDSSKGLFAAMPSYKVGNGEYKGICFPITKEFRRQLNDAVIDAYRQALNMGQRKGESQAPFEAPEQNSGMQMG
ncbi:SpoVG family protein [Pelotomaculum terephthalicicum JT]|uniref:SpoVG family protein n=1 Tax=Pelotomaculum terephthalicicum TaxID=206393 RepID=UPI001F04B447|nr:SpoVG family protein [Pelotomaculum terephthalicicum]MCG9969209.1 SpoVG family protein [Pelotomaculum terephthalicicum JT]